MSKAPSFQWYPKDILGSARVAEMSLAEEGAYRRLIDYCWLNGSVPADPTRAARVIGKGCSVETASFVLCMFDPDPADGSRLIHSRLEEERTKQAANSEARRKASEARWTKAGKTGEVPGSESKVTADESKCNANAYPNALQMESIAFASASANKESNSNELPKKRGTRLPSPFSLTPDMRQWAKDRKPSVDVELETEKFCNYWRAKAGRDATKLDWAATWRNWILSAKDGGNGTIRRDRQSSADNIRQQDLSDLSGIDPIAEFAVDRGRG